MSNQGCPQKGYFTAPNAQSERGGGSASRKRKQLKYMNNMTHDSSLKKLPRLSLNLKKAFPRCPYKQRKVGFHKEAPKTDGARG